MSIEVSRADLTRIVVSVDPAGSANEDSDDTGIIVCARGVHQPSTCKIPPGIPCPGHGYVLDDLTCHLLPTEWAAKAIGGYDTWKADRIVAEVNFGAKMVEAVMRSVRAGIPFAEVNASRGKHIRAEPVASLQEQGRIHFCGEFPELEEELTTWTPDEKVSPNRLDALVWGFTHLGLVGGQGDAFLAAWSQELQQRPVNPTPPELQGKPTPSDDPSEGLLKPGCKHRWMDKRCVYCGGKKPWAN